MTEKSERYNLLVQQVQSLLTGEADLVANMANLVSLVFHELPDLNGTTYYRLIKGELVLGPFQGKPACMHIPIGRGVCGTVAVTQKPEVVPDVDQFIGHIACDSASRSEVVVPVFRHGSFWGVLDLDSPKLNTFDEVDAEYLSLIAGIIFPENQKES